MIRVCGRRERPGEFVNVLACPRTVAQGWAVVEQDTHVAEG
jgi:hypothetical protein